MGKAQVLASGGPAWASESPQHRSPTFLCSPPYRRAWKTNRLESWEAHPRLGASLDGIGLRFITYLPCPGGLVSARIFMTISGGAS